MDLKEFKKPKSKGILKEVAPKKTKKQNLSAKVYMSFTPEEKEKLQTLADDYGVNKVATIIRMLLKNHGYI